MTKSVKGLFGDVPASTSPKILSLFETLMHHLVVKKSAYICRSQAANTVLSVDGQLRGYQSMDHAQEWHCIRAVRGVDSLLLARPTVNEGHLDLLQSLVSATQGFQMDRVSQTGNVRMIFSDTPAKLGNPDVYAVFHNVECIATGPLHIALNIDRAYGENESELTVLLRRCLNKLSLMGNESSSYFRNRDPVSQRHRFLVCGHPCLLAQCNAKNERCGM